MTSLEVHYMHPHVFGPRGWGRATIAWTQLSGKDVVVGVAWCSPHDQFTRCKGRLIARGRLRVRPFVIHLEIKDNPANTWPPAVDYLVKAFDHALTNDRRPNWARDCIVTLSSPVTP